MPSHSVVVPSLEGAFSGAVATYAIVQTGKLGDLWFTVPLADHLSDLGHRVEVWYDATYDAPFRYFPSIVPRPVGLPNIVLGSGRFGRVVNAVAKQAVLRARVSGLGRRVVRNEIYPFRLDAYLANRPYPESWYRPYPGVDFRRARTTLRVENVGTILYFAASSSLRVEPASANTPWLEDNVARLAEHTGCRVIYVPPPDAPEHHRFETFRGDAAAYQRLIASCDIVFGIITSAHVLGQLLGKAVVACYIDRRMTVDTIGGETIRLYPLERLDNKSLAVVSDSLRQQRARATVVEPRA